MAGTKHTQGGVAAHVSQRRYPKELRERAVRMVLDSYDRGEERFRVHTENLEVYGVRKVWRQLLREGDVVGRDRVGRLMDAMGLQGATRSKRTRTTFPAAVAERPADLVEPRMHRTGSGWRT